MDAVGNMHTAALHAPLSSRQRGGGRVSHIKAGGGVGLDAYTWDGRRYRHVESGKFVARATIVDLLRGVVDGAGDVMSGLGRAAAKGWISPAVFERAMQIELKHAVNANTALAAGGWDRVTPSMRGRSGAELKKQYALVRGFAAELAAGNLSPEQAAARARLYADAAYARYGQEERRRQAAQGVARWRWVTARDDRVCSICAPRDGQTVAVESQMLPIHPGCRCDVQPLKGAP